MRTSAISVPSHREQQTLPPSRTPTRRVIAGTPRTRPPIHSSGAPYRPPAFRTEPLRPTRTSPLQTLDAVYTSSRYPARETLSTSAGPRPPKLREPPSNEREASRRAAPGADARGEAAPSRARASAPRADRRLRRTRLRITPPGGAEKQRRASTARARASGSTLVRPLRSVAPRDDVLRPIWMGDQGPRNVLYA